MENKNQGRIIVNLLAFATFIFLFYKLIYFASILKFGSPPEEPVSVSFVQDRINDADTFFLKCNHFKHSLKIYVDSQEDFAKLKIYKRTHKFGDYDLKLSELENKILVNKIVIELTRKGKIFSFEHIPCTKTNQSDMEELMRLLRKRKELEKLRKEGMMRLNKKSLLNKDYENF